MKVGIGLPNAVPGTSGADLVEWARRAESREFSTLGTIDRVAYDNYEPLIALAAAAAVTERIGLCTSVLLGPLRAKPAVLAKLTLSLNALSDGRFTLGIAIGGREDDYEVSRIGMEGRGAWLDDALDEIKAIWEGDEIGPSRSGAPGLVIGGYVDASLQRAARVADGWIAGGQAPDEYKGMVEKLNAAWSEAGREGSPRKMALALLLARRRRRGERKRLPQAGLARRPPATSLAAPPRTPRRSSSTSPPSRKPAATS